MWKWIKRLALGLLIVLVASAAIVGYIWRTYLDSGLSHEEVRIAANGETLASVECREFLQDTS